MLPWPPLGEIKGGINWKVIVQNCYGNQITHGHSLCILYMWQLQKKKIVTLKLVFIPIVIKMHTQVSYITKILYDNLYSIY